MRGFEINLFKFVFFLALLVRIAASGYNLRWKPFSAGL